MRLFRPSLAHPVRSASRTVECTLVAHLIFVVQKSDKKEYVLQFVERKNERVLHKEVSY